MNTNATGQDTINFVLEQLSDASIDIDQAVDAISNYVQNEDKLKIALIVKEIGCDVLDLKMEDVMMDHALSDYGMDSIIFMDFFRSLNSLFDCIEIDMFDQNITLSDLAQKIEKHTDRKRLDAVNLKQYRQMVKQSNSMMVMGNRKHQESRSMVSGEIEKQRQNLLGQLSAINGTRLSRKILINKDQKIPSFQSFDLMVDERLCLWVIFKTKIMGPREIDEGSVFEAFLRQQVDLEMVPIVYFTHYGRHFSLGGDRLFMAQANRDEPKNDKFLEFAAKAKANFEIDIPDNAPLRVAVCAGTAQGFGFEFLISCDFQFVWPHSKLGLPEIKSHLYAGMGGLSYLSTQIGLARTKLLNMSGGLIFGHQAYEMGLVSHLSNNPFHDAYHFYETIPNIKIAKHINRRLNQQYKSIKNRDLDDWAEVTRSNIAKGYKHIRNDYKMINSD